MEFVTVETHGAVALVRLDRPPVNALNAQVADELLEAFTSCQDRAIRAVVVTGQPHFAAGADIKGFKESLDSGARERSANKLVDAIAALENLEKPTIAAVHGFALGGGCELSMGADFRYVAEDARIGQPEILLGIIPGAGGTQRLQRLVGYQKAKELVLTGRHIDAREAHAIGYADKVLPTEAVLETAMADAAEWGTKATVAISAAKRALNAGRLPFDEAMAVEAAEFQRSFSSDDAREGIDAFVAKRDPDFRGT